MTGFLQGAFQIAPNATPEQIARKRALIAAMMPRFGQARYVGEGLGQLAAGIGMRALDRSIDRREAAGEAEASDLFSRIVGGASGGGPLSIGGSVPSGTWTPAPPAPKPTSSYMGKPDVASGGLSFNGQPPAPPVKGGLSFGSAVMTPQEMLIEGAKARGLDPIDVATAISYETGGKFDPTIKGPTTQWGQHEGLIQFGDPQGVEHGAVFDQGPEAAWRSQLDPNNGAVWSYLASTGVKPGMGLPDIYSAINAGGVGRMDASDANNGGAPGTVADKVAGMGDHRQNAAAFLGGTWTPSNGTTTSTQGAAPVQPMAGVGMPQLYAALANPWMTEQQRSIITSMIAQQQQASDPLRALELQKAQMELAQMQGGGQKEPINVGGVLLDPETYQPIFDSRADAARGTEYGLQPQYGVDADGNPVLIQIGKDGTATQTKLPDGVTFQKEPIKVDAGTEWILLDPISRQPVGRVPKGVREAASEGAIGKAEGDAKGKAIVQQSVAAQQAQQAVSLIDSIIADPALPGITGMIQGRLPPMSQGGTDLEVKIKQLQGKAFLEAFESLKGAGAITEQEGKAATEAMARLNRAQSTEAYVAALTELKAIMVQGAARTAAMAGGQPAAPQATPQPSQPGKTRLRYNPQTGAFE